jgi:hypothetical protein
MWSVFNEEPSQGTEMGYELVRRMSVAVKELDPTRPVTAAQSNSVLNPVNASQAADVAGFNYVYRDKCSQDAVDRAFGVSSQFLDSFYSQAELNP